MKFRQLALVALGLPGLLIVDPCLAGQLHRDFPAEIDPTAIYVFYSHGAIVEGGNPKPKHPKWGVYDFPAVNRELADSDFDLIAWHRPQKTKPPSNDKPSRGAPLNPARARLSASRCWFLAYRSALM